MFLGKKSAAMTPGPPPKEITLPNSGLDPYTGPWEYEQAAHLLRRAMFGPTYAQIRQSVEQGMEVAIDTLFAQTSLPAPPINYNFGNDPNVPIGNTWIDAPYSATVNLRPYRNRSLRAWTFGLMIEEGMSIREKLTLFWHNHFSINNINDPKFLYRYITLLRSRAWGNFRDLVKEVTIDPAMLRFLNGNQNTVGAPNENYARELLELFTIGKGPAIGPGDYTNYTEDDVVQIARVLTGWRDRGFNTLDPNVQVDSFFRPNQHDTGAKQLSHRFDNTVITNMGAQEYAHLIDIIFQKDEVARFICRKLYRWFIYYIINDEAEVNVIEPMAQMLIDSDYEIEPALRALLGSEHFYDMLNVGPMIKNPLDFAMSAIKQFSIPFPPAINQRYTAWDRLFNATRLMQMEYYNPPDVAGWKAYYQDPQYYRTWINATTLPLRMALTDLLAMNGFLVQGFRLRINPLTFIQTIDNPYDPNEVIKEFARTLFPQPLTDSQKAALKEALIPGLPDYEWSVEYGQHVANPADAALAAAIEAKLRNLIQVMLAMPEFHLS